MAPWRTHVDDNAYSPQPLPDLPQRLSVSEIRRSVGRRSFQGMELLSAFTSRFPGRPAQSIPNANPQPVEFNVNIFGAPPAEMDSATETKISSIESLHRYAQYTGRYPKLGLFDYPSEEEEEGSDDTDEDNDQESNTYEVEDEAEDIDQEMSIPDGCDPGIRGGFENAEPLNDETHHENLSHGQGRSNSMVVLDVDSDSREQSASSNGFSTSSPSPGIEVHNRTPEPEPKIQIHKPTMGGKTILLPRTTSTKLQHKATQRRIDDHDDYSESSSEEDDEEEDDDLYVPSLGPALSRLSANTPPVSSSSTSTTSRKRKRGGASQGQRNRTTTAASAPTASTPSVSVSIPNSASYKAVTERSGKTGYQCLLCPNFRTKALGDMTRHLESLIHQDRSYACDVAGCEGLFTRKDALVRHKKLVHDPSKSKKKKKAKRQLEC